MCEELSRKRLEFELSLSWTDIRSHAWYHGKVERSLAEQLLANEGHFLVRDCSTRTGDYVLSCLSSGHFLHFLISKLVLQPNTVYERIEYTFEDECFDTITDLITFYVGNKRPISVASNAVITTPLNRTIPLTSDENEDELNPPPKPSRIAQHKHDVSLFVDECNQNNGSNGSEDSAFFSQETNIYDNYRKELFTNPPQISSCFVNNFQTYLLPKDNKPLDLCAITKIVTVLTNTGARILANHLAKCDLQFIKHCDKRHDLGLGVESALELILLPQGQQMRRDLLERHECLKYFVVFTILTTINELSASMVLNKWIEIAIESKTALGDLFAFAAIMEALSMSPIIKLKTIWDLVRKDFTQNAIIYETKLKPQMKRMTEANEPQAPNTTFPFVLTLLQILERHENMAKNDIQITSLNFSFEQTAVDYGLQQIYNHLESGPKMIEQLSNYRRNGYIVLDGFQCEELLYDMFRTEFHRQFMFGFRGSIIDSKQRFDKLDQIVIAFMRQK